MNKFLLFLSATFLGLLLFAAPIKAEENPENLTKKYNISFPVAELGNCGSFSQCRTFCDQEENRNTCMAFAKKKGFYNEESKYRGQQGNPEMMQAAKSELGCDGEASCRSVCEREENFQKCSTFAQKYKLDGPQKGPGDMKVLQKAKEILGCESESSCRAVCEKEENQQKCSEFAKQTGLGGGMRRVGPGGCNSEESCRAYCEKNMDECRKFGGGPPTGAESNRRGPGGCDSEQSCRAYCEKNPEQCKKFGGDEPAGVREQFCRENPDKCAGGGPMSQEEFCRQNPDKCSGSRGGIPTSPEEFCKLNPDKCQPPAESYRDFRDSFRQPTPYNYTSPATEQYRLETPTSSEQTQPVSETYSAPTTNQSPSESTAQEPAPSTSTSSDTSLQQVRGVSTVRSLLDIVLDWFR